MGVKEVKVAGFTLNFNTFKLFKYLIADLYNYLPSVSVYY